MILEVRCCHHTLRARSTAHATQRNGSLRAQDTAVCTQDSTRKVCNTTITSYPHHPNLYEIQSQHYQTQSRPLLYHLFFVSYLSCGLDCSSLISSFILSLLPLFFSHFLFSSLITFSPLTTALLSPLFYHQYNRGWRRR